jgi:hypothetical protein
VGHLSLFDVMGTPGVAADLSHMNTKAKVEVRPCVPLGVQPRPSCACAPTAASATRRRHRGGLPLHAALPGNARAQRVALTARVWGVRRA